MSAPGISLGGLGSYRAAVEARLTWWQGHDVGRRFWAKDPTLWPEAPATDVASRMGWIDLPDALGEAIRSFSAFADEVRAEGFRDALVLGMGGSSLAPDLFARTFPPAPESLRVRVLDSTHPAAVSSIAAEVDLAHTLFVVSSKSGTTLEPNSFYRYFRDRVGALGGHPGRRFAAITDPGTALETLARTEGFRRVFSAPADVGGRYSALTPFGLLPAALGGVNVARLLAAAEELADLAGPAVPVAENPAFVLAATLGELGRIGRDKVTFLPDPEFAAFPDWVEQLIAESTGKRGRGLVPVVDEPSAEVGVYGADRLFVSLETALGPATPQLRALEAAGIPVVRIAVGERFALGGAFLLWEIAVAMAGSVLGIDPYDQPDVELAKELARAAMGHAAAAADAQDPPTVVAAPPTEAAAAVRRWASAAGPTDYLGLQAYLAPSTALGELLDRLRGSLLTTFHRATTSGYGPRFLHSTGQLHKGGPPTGRFLQLVDTPAKDVPVPGTDYTFGAVIRAQAVGDARALAQRGRTVLRLELGAEAVPALAAVVGALDG